MPENAAATDADWFSDAAATFGDRLAGAREAAGLSQADLAQRLGVTLESLRSWEDDRSEPRSNRLQMLAGLLNVSIAWLLTGEGEGLEAPPQDRPAASEPAAIPDELGPAVLAEIRDIRARIEAEVARLAALEARLAGGRNG
ncbi:helix-turn-helix domain-containing protein [Palleronia sp. KMU-117]|uniref:helix-turn-helix domain-containing protein n=1 Tax=Palleronia sp. KMU-117 TaxID=3434108 RepID=UPI003D73C064